LQVTLGDKLLSALLSYLGEKLGPMIDNLNRAERWGFIESAIYWSDIRNLRNQLIHENIKDLNAVATSLNGARGARNASERVNQHTICLTVIVQRLRKKYQYSSQLACKLG
jgi:hypothetical protein